MFTLISRCRPVYTCIRGLVFISMALLISNCEKEKEHFRSYPRVADMAVTDISDNGARFKASVYSLGTEPIIDHGFVWGNYPNPEIGNFDKVYLGSTDRTGEFTSEILTNLIKDREYYVKPFLLTADHIIYGAAVSFVSLGSGAPVISGFEPHIAGWMDTIIIRGHNFSYRSGVNIVKLDNVNCEVIESTDTLLRAVVSYQLSSPKAILSVDNVGNIATFTQDTFRLVPPRLIDFYPKQARWDDTIYIKGQYLKYPLYLPGNSISLGSFKCRFLGSLNDSIYIFKVPYELNVLNSELSVSVNGFALKSNNLFELKSPEPITFEPTTGTWGSTITLSGSFNTLLSANSVYFDDIQGTIQSVSADRMNITVPDNLEKVSTNIIYKADPFTIVSSDTFRLEPPVITSFSPQSGAGQSVLDIYGKYFGTGDVSVMMDTTSCLIMSKTDTHIAVKVPAGIDGTFKITVKVKLQSAISAEEFTVTNPVITGISSLTGTFNDQVTISGRNLVTDAGTAVVLFGNDQVRVLSSSSTSITVAVPATIDSIPREISVTTGLNKIAWPEKFTLVPPVITSVTPGPLSPGQDVTITGQNFNPDLTGNTVLWDVYPLTIKSCSSTEIIATMPLSLPRGNYRLKAVIGGYQRYSTDYYDIQSEWLRINYNQPFHWYNTGSTFEIPVSFTQDGKGYTLNHEGYLFSFDPAAGLLVAEGYRGEFRSRNGLRSVTNMDTSYVLGGYYSGPAMYRFNQSTKQFSFVTNTPVSSAFGASFSLNGEIYYGLTGFLDNRFWKYINPGGWEQRSALPGTINTNVLSYYSINDKGYVLIADKSLYSYDPVTDTWSALASFPGDLMVQGMISFTLNGKAYIGLGSYSNNMDTNEIWSYDPGTDSWELATRIPWNSREYPIVFTINGKAYIGFGYHYLPGSTSATELTDFYEFDPSYLTK